ncbi:uncharacterized protein LOC131859008 [Cryptomeria japonica]|uniref:uncharacterized protein LOC131859008 n=1 Tax=Cryptomeria japonica TaxID=3369 RepID=UPI0027DA2172|nr:uncharacterized protein LOC131859008 [Cryptomeria japonica]
MPLNNATDTKILGLLEDLVTRFGSPKTIILDNASEFMGSRVTHFSLDHDIFLKTSSNCYLLGNGLAESTNKNLIKLIKRKGAEHKRKWHKHLQNTLWVDHITSKQILKISPYELVYGKEAQFLIYIKILALQLLKSLELEENDPMEVRLAELQELQEKNEKAFNSLNNRQRIVEKWFDKKSSNSGFKCGDLVVKYNEWGAKPGQHARFDSSWEGSFRIYDYKEFNA